MYTVTVNFKSGKKYRYFDIEVPKYFMAKVYGTKINNCAVESISVGQNYLDLDEIEVIATERGW